MISHNIDSLCPRLNDHVVDFNLNRDNQRLGLWEQAIDGPRKWHQRTPALAAQITNHIWSPRELLDYSVS